MKKLLIILAMTLCITSCDSNHHTFSFSLGASTEFVDSIYIETKQVLTEEERTELKEFVTTHMKRGEDINTILHETLVLADAKMVKFKKVLTGNSSFLPPKDREICYLVSETSDAYIIVLSVFLVILGLCLVR